MALPVSNGLKAACNASAKWLTGKMAAKWCSQAGALDVGMKTLEMNIRGSMEALMIAGAASALGTKELTANPRLVKQAAPKIKETMNAGSFTAPSWTSKNTTPNTRMMATRSSATVTA